jgi:hypothetical protein
MKGRMGARPVVYFSPPLIITESGLKDSRREKLSQITYRGVA